MGWKVHALIHHLPTWFAEANTGLALYCEQTTASVHSKIKPTLLRYCVNTAHKQHGEQLRKAAI